MFKLTLLQEEVEKYIDKNRIHLSCFALFNKKLFKDKKTMENEIRNGKIILTNSVGKFLMQKQRIDKYITELPETVNGQRMTKLDFKCYVFSSDQLKVFVEMIRNHKVSRIIH